MTRVLFHFIRPLLILTLLLASSATAGVTLQLDARTETKAIDALVRFLPHPDSTSTISPTGTLAKVEINVRANGKQMVALETTPPEGSLSGRLELVAARGLLQTDDFQILLKGADATPTLMAEVRGGIVIQSTGAALPLSQIENGQLLYQPAKTLSATAEFELDLVMTPPGVEGIELRYRYHLSGGLSETPVLATLR